MKKSLHLMGATILMSCVMIQNTTTGQEIAVGQFNTITVPDGNYLIPDPSDLSWMFAPEPLNSICITDFTVTGYMTQGCTWELSPPTGAYYTTTRQGDTITWQGTDLIYGSTFQYVQPNPTGVTNYYVGVGTISSPYGDITQPILIADPLASGVDFESNDAGCSFLWDPATQSYVRKSWWDRAMEDIFGF